MVTLFPLKRGKTSTVFSNTGYSLTFIHKCNRFMKATMLYLLLFFNSPLFASCDDSQNSKTDDSQPYPYKAQIFVYPDKTEKDLSVYMSGFNMSYYHDKDQLWTNSRLTDALKDIRTGILRYPGGAETAYLHWRYPGCPGYKDLWNPEHGINMDEISKITENMDTDEFIALCRKTNAEPMMGINIQSGVVNNRLDDSLQEAIDWMNYCTTMGYNVKYWYLDGEVDHWGSYTQITVEEYAGIIRRFSQSLKAVNPNIKLIVNLIGGATVGNQKKLIDLAGDCFDFIDFHYYHAWDISEWKGWTAQTPMRNPDTGMTYTEEINSLTPYIKNSINPNIGMVCLEWNIGPSQVDVMSDYKQALMQTEMFQQFLRSDLQMASIWPLIWQVKEGQFPSLFDQHTYEVTPLYHIMKLYNVVLGNAQIQSNCSDSQVVTHCATDQQTVWICGINKHEKQQRAIVMLDGTKNYSKAIVHHVYSDNIDNNHCRVSSQEISIDSKSFTLDIPPYSFFRIELNVQI